MRRESDCLGVTAAVDVTVLGDGAVWIWNLADAHLPQAANVLDALEHVCDAAKAVWGIGTAAAKAQADTDRDSLLADGKPGRG